MWSSSVNGPVAQWISIGPRSRGLQVRVLPGSIALENQPRRSRAEPKKGLEALARPGARVVWKKWSRAGSNRRPYGY